MKPPMGGKATKEPDWTYVIQAVLYTGSMTTGKTHRLYARLYTDLFNWLQSTDRI